jgi:hypothetical protein
VARPRAAPAQPLAALSHRLIQGFFIGGCYQCRPTPRAFPRSARPCPSDWEWR